MKREYHFLILIIFICVYSCNQDTYKPNYHFVGGESDVNSSTLWLSHEHILVDFIGADSIDPQDWEDELVIDKMLPYLTDLKSHNVSIFVDATPQFLGRDVKLLQRLSQQSGLHIMTNTGLYGAVGNKYVPKYAFQSSARELADMWIEEFDHGIDNTDIRPGFIKISVNDSTNLSEMDAKLVHAAALTHKATGLTIGSHTGPARALWPQLDILKSNGVDPSAFIWIHAQNEQENGAYLKAAEMGCWISLDGLGWDIDNHLKKLVFAKENDILDHILVSHDSGWYDPQKKEQNVKPYTKIFEKLIPALLEEGFTNEEIGLLLSQNPSRCFKLGIKLL